MAWKCRASVSLSSRVRTDIKNSLTLGSAFISSNGRKSSSFHGRRINRSVVINDAPENQLGSRPLRRPLVQKGIHAFTKVMAHVAGQDQVAVFFRSHPFLDAAQGLLGYAQRERRLGGQSARKFIRTALQ